ASLDQTVENADHFIIVHLSSSLESSSDFDTHPVGIDEATRIPAITISDPALNAAKGSCVGVGNAEESETEMGFGTRKGSSRMPMLQPASKRNRVRSSRVRHAGCALATNSD